MLVGKGSSPEFRALGAARRRAAAALLVLLPFTGRNGTSPHRLTPLIAMGLYKHQNQHRPRGPMDKASAYGAGDCRFESCRGHIRHLLDHCKVRGSSPRGTIASSIYRDPAVSSIGIQADQTRSRRTKI